MAGSFRTGDEDPNLSRHSRRAFEIPPFFALRPETADPRVSFRAPGNSSGDESSSSTRGAVMSSDVYSVSEIVGSSTDSIEEAIENAVARARKTLRNLNWFEVTEVRGHLGDDGSVAHYQVTLKLGFKMED
jgi:dodecin